MDLTEPTLPMPRSSRPTSPSYPEGRGFYRGGPLHGCTDCEPQLANCPATLPRSDRQTTICGPVSDYTGVEPGKGIVVDAPGALLAGECQIEWSQAAAEWMERVGLAAGIGSEFHVPLVLRATDYNRFRLFQCRLRGRTNDLAFLWGRGRSPDPGSPMLMDFSNDLAHLVTGQGGNWSGSDSGAGTTFSESEFLVFRTGVDAKVGKAHTNLADVNFSSCLFPEDFQFTRVLVSGANFTGATLNSTNGVGFEEMDATNALFTNAALSGVDFVPANLTGASFGGADLTGVTGICPDGSSSATSNNTCCGAPLGSVPSAGCTIITAADIATLSFTDSTQHTNAYFVGLDLNDVDFSGADLRFSVVANCTADQTNFEGATLTGTQFSGTDLSTATRT